MKATTRQSILDVLGMVRMAFRYGDEVPGPGDGASDTLFRLPFEGAWVVLNGGVTEATSHSWDVWGQRYAYDFVVADGGATFSGDPADVHSYFCYGLPVLAPADGVVAEARDGDPDTPPALDGTVGCAGGDIRGNHVVIRHASGEHSTLAHLAPGSVCVRPGQEVRAGDVIGRCGSSGNSSEPHLHLHMQAGASFYTSPGVPVRFTGIEAERVSNYGKLDPRPQPNDPLAAFPPFLTRGLLVRNTSGGRR